MDKRKMQDAKIRALAAKNKVNENRTNRVRALTRNRREKNTAFIPPKRTVVLSREKSRETAKKFSLMSAHIEKCEDYTLHPTKGWRKSGNRYLRVSALTLSSERKIMSRAELAGR
jgi:hypothetical protein